jgi:ribosomal protein S18 acetylase RimI-like enzyme
MPEPDEMDDILEDKIREATLKDVNFIYQAGQKAFSQFNTERGGETCLKALEPHEGQESICFICTRLNYPTGFAIIHIADDRAYLAAIAVDEKLRRSGIGRKLLAECINRVLASKDGSEKLIQLNVAKGNDSAIALFESFGFKHRSHAAGTYKGGQIALIMIRMPEENASFFRAMQSA